MNFGEIKTATRNMLSDNINFTPSDPSAVSAQAFTDEQYFESVNFACKSFAGKTGVTYKEVSGTALTTYTASIPGSGNYISVKTVIDNSGNHLYRTTLEKESNRFKNWRSSWSNANAPERWFMLDGSSVAIVPGFPVSPAVPKFGVIDTPTVWTSGGAVTDATPIDVRIPSTYHEYLKYAAGASLLQNMDDTQAIALSEKWMTIFSEMIKEVANGNTF